MLLFHVILSFCVKAKAWLEDRNELLEQKIAEWTAHSTPKRKSVVLRGPENLEGRITPATIDLWVGPAGGNFSTPANWAINGQPGVPQNGDALQFGSSVGNVNGTNASAIDDMAGLSVFGLTIAGNYNQTITLNNDLTVTSGVTITGSTNPTIAGTGTLTIHGGGGMTWGAGTFNAPVVLAAGTTTNINQSDVTLNNTLTNNGTINWSSYNPQQGPGPNISLGANGVIKNVGTFNITTASTESITGAGAIQNSGTMQKTGANQTTVAASYSEQSGGLLTINSGTLAFQNTFQTAGDVVLNGGNLSSVNTVLIQSGGTLSGVGTVTVSGAGQVVDNHGTVTPGVNGVPGVMSIIGDYTQESDGTLVINIDSAGNCGLLDCGPMNGGGTMILAGTLTVNKNANYQPPAGTVLTFLEWLTVQGDFSSITINNNYWENGGPLAFQASKTMMSYTLDAQSV